MTPSGDFVFKLSASVFRSIIDSLAVGIYVLDRDLKVQWANVRIFKWLKKASFRQFKGRPCYEIFLERDDPCEGCPVLKAFDSGRTERLELKLEREGEARHFLLTATPLWKGRKKEFTHVVEMVQDITFQKETEDELRRLNEFNRAIIDNAPIAVFTLDREGVFTSVNPALAKISGLGFKAEEKLVGFNWLKNAYTRECGLAKYIEMGLSGQPFELRDFPFITFRGDKKLYMDFKGVPLKNKNGDVEGLLCIIEETTERVKARAQLIQQAKISAIGRLATGIAHELNNPLATIAAHGELACEILESVAPKVEGSEDIRELQRCLEVIQSQAFRCKKIIENLLSLARKEGFELKKVSLKALLDELLELVNFKKLKIRLEKEFEPGSLDVLGDPNALRQAFLSIIHNAVDAVEGRNDPTIRVRARENGEMVEVEIEDNGIGIPPDVIDKIFDPFFTTKGSRKGAGLGLTLCYEFLTKMGGSVEVESEPGKGSIFKVLLPIYRGREADDTGFDS